MYEVVVEDTFSAAHKLRNYKGKCENLHGHNWKVVVCVKGDMLDDKGILLDFHILKDELKEILKIFDHKDINKISFFKKANPTSENIASYIYKKIQESLNKYSVKINYVKVWESDKQFAKYSEIT
jgi:6-pyruvoyltetrahydropterin/6-carboxytetrahydropterin synthase